VVWEVELVFVGKVEVFFVVGGDANGVEGGHEMGLDLLAEFCEG